jgi:hypothetical protein
MQIQYKHTNTVSYPIPARTPPGFCGVRVAQSLGFDFVDHCYCFMYLFIKQLHCLFFFNLQLLGRRPATIRSRPRRSPDEQDTIRGQDYCRGHNHRRCLEEIPKSPTSFLIIFPLSVLVIMTTIPSYISLR